MQTSQYKYLRFVRFRDFFQWDLKRYFNQSIHSKFQIFNLGTLISEEKDKFDVSDPKTDYGILGVNNQTGIFDAYIENGSKIKQKYKKMEVGWIAYNPYRVNVGSVGIKRECHNNLYISPAYVVFSCKQSLDPEFLYMALKTPLYNRVIRENTTGSVRQNLSFEVLSTLPIPLPTMAEQQAFVEAYNAKIKAAEEKERRAEQLNNEIEDYLLGELGIKKQQHTDKADLLLKFVRFKGVEEWGYDKIIGSNFGLLKSNLYDNKKLNELLEINPSTSFLSLNDNDELSFIPMECISDEFGEWKERRKCKKKDSKGYTKFQSGDLIWARITPCMQNGKSAIVDNLESGLGCGSTEFHVLRNKESGLNLQFVHLILRQPMVLDDAKRSFTGSAGQQRVPKSYLENLSIPFPPISIQNAIVEHANQLKEQMKQLKQEAKELRENALVEFEKEIFEN